MRFPMTVLRVVTLGPALLVSFVLTVVMCALLPPGLGLVVFMAAGGVLVALAMGLRHGAYCLGCCWALFAVLVAAGVMSLAWMLLLTVVVIVEKILPRGRLLSAAIGIALIALGSLVAGGAATMPWLSQGSW